MTYDELTPAQVSSALHKQVSRAIYVPKGRTLGEKYRALGRHYGKRIRASAVQRIEYLLEEELFAGEVSIAQRILQNLQKHTSAQEYLQALSGWAEGAELEQVASLYVLEKLTLAMMTPGVRP